MATSRPTFFVKRSDRLIARLRNILYGVRFARQVDGVVIAVWTPVSWFSEQFDGTDFFVDRIFDLREYYANGGYNDMIFYHCVSPYPKGIKNLSDPEFDEMRPKRFSRQALSAPGFVGYNDKFIGFQFEDEGKSDAQMEDEVRDIYYSLPLEEFTRRALAAAKERIKSDGYVVLHVRRGDISGMLRRDLPKLAAGDLPPAHLRITMGHYLARTAPFQFYYPEVEKAIASGVKILFSSDSPETFDHFADKFGKRHFININDVIKGRYPIQQAFLDFNLFIGAQKIISTASTYATFAASLGRIEAVNVGKSGTPEQWEQALIDDYAPDLANDAASRATLMNEIAALRRRTPE